jgi:hypothetical protein
MTRQILKYPMTIQILKHRTLMQTLKYQMTVLIFKHQTKMQILKHSMTNIDSSNDNANIDLSNYNQNIETSNYAMQIFKKSWETTSTQDPQEFHSIVQESKRKTNDQFINASDERTDENMCVTARVTTSVIDECWWKTSVLKESWCSDRRNFIKSRCESGKLMHNQRDRENWCTSRVKEKVEAKAQWRENWCTSRVIKLMHERESWWTTTLIVQETLANRDDQLV